MRKVNFDAVRPWIVKKFIELSEVEDEIVAEYALEMLEDKDKPVSGIMTLATTNIPKRLLQTPDPKMMQIHLTPFMPKNIAKFMAELWIMLLDAQASDVGVPRALLEEKKEQMRQARATDTRAIEERDRRVRLDEIRANERDGRGSGRGRGRPMRGRDSGWGGRGGGVRIGTILLTAQGLIIPTP